MDIDLMLRRAGVSLAMLVVLGCAFRQGVAAQQEMRRTLIAVLDSAALVRVKTDAEAAFMRRAALVLAQLPDSARGPRAIRSVDDAARALEDALRVYGMAKATVFSTPPGFQAEFRRVYDTTAVGFTVTAVDSADVAPAWYRVICKRPGKPPVEAQLADCTSRCRVVCQSEP